MKGLSFQLNPPLSTATGRMLKVIYLFATLILLCMHREGGLKGIEILKSVIRSGICTACGACVGICPYIKSIDDRVAVIEDCPIDMGRCYYYCPRTFLDVPYMSKRVFGDARTERDADIGRYISVFACRSLDDRRKMVQYGGVVSSILSYAIRSGVLDAVVVTGSEESLFPVPRSFIARSEEEVISSGGTKYTMCASLSAVNESARMGVEKIGFVGTPCQVSALRKMQIYEGEVKSEGIYKNMRLSERIGLVVGLFCMWSLSHDFLGYLEGIGISLSSIRKLDIPPDGFLIFTENGVKKLPLDDVRSFIRPACDVCYDMTSEFADISVGALEGVDNWNTVIVRTKTGEKLLDKMEDQGIIERKEMEEERLEHLRWASMRKKAKALSQLPSDSYLIIGEERSIIEKFMENEVL